MPPKAKIQEEDINELKKSVVELKSIIDIRFDDIKNDILNIKETVIQNLLKDNNQLRVKIKLLEEKLVHVESECYGQDQYSRRNNFEINGIPNSVNDDDLEEKIIEVLDAIDITVDKSEIEACHRLPGKNKEKTTIVRFVNRKLCENALKNRKKLKHCDKTSLGFSEDQEIYFNENLCPYYKKLSWMCRQLKRDKMIVSSWTEKGIVLKIEENAKKIKIRHENDLLGLFPDYVFFK